MPVVTQVYFSMRGERLFVRDITEQLGIEPTSGFDPHEPYEGRIKIGGEIRTVERNRPAFGTWHYRTEPCVSSLAIEDHALFLLAKFEPLEPILRSFLSGHDIHIRIRLWHVGSTGFDLSASTVARLARLCHAMSFNCFETGDEEE